MQRYEQEKQEQKIYSVTDGISSFYTKREYFRNFNHFLYCSGLVDAESLVRQARDSPRLVESLIIEHVKHLAEKQKLRHKSIHVHCYAIGQDSTDNLITLCNGDCHKKLEPYRETFALFITGDTYNRMSNLVGNVGNDEEKIIWLCEELEKQRLKTMKDESGMLSRVDST